MRISNVEYYFCINCLNRKLCLPENEFSQSTKSSQGFKNRDFMFFRKDKDVFKVGDNADEIFNIYYGNVKIYRTDENNNEIILYHADDGESIGYNSIVKGYYINSAKTLEDTFFCSIKISEVEKLKAMKQPIIKKILAGF